MQKAIAKRMSTKPAIQPNRYYMDDTCFMLKTTGAVLRSNRERKYIFFIKIFDV